ncbi:SGF29 tudor-like domain-containing protein [Schizophyllum amplum]|uniref:SGF29 tudor-like domain-containing protein n=1 Tax=Schizophyllum amplum TaxID=97359 RepID=A0A550CVG9_9AGAR|nr:SGF29 tudor-like domain-containing protein [Auriculariopsis ampla]
MRHQATSEELQCWRATSASLDALNNVHEAASEKGALGRANRWISIWPESVSDADEDYDTAKRTAQGLASALRDIRVSCERESRSLDDAIDRISALLALRKASEARALPPPPPRTREEPTRRRDDLQRKHELTSSEPVRKRQRLESSPSASVSSPDSGAAPATPRVTITLPPRTRGVPAQRLPLKPGRQVVYRLAEGGTEDTSWILAIVVKAISKDRTRYLVRDADAGEDGKYTEYRATLSNLIALPDPAAPPSTSASLGAYPELPAGSDALAMYPDTTCFYRAQVLEPPRVTQRDKSLAGNSIYKLKFEDDESPQHLVSAYWVVPWPGA